MRVLLDTNVLIHREARTVVREDIGSFFNWLDQMRCEKCVHPDSLEEIREHADPEVVRSLERKLGSYFRLKTRAPDTPSISALRQQDSSKNDRVDTSILAELAADRVDAIVTEDRGIHEKARRLGIDERTYTIDGFLEKALAENPALAEYKVLAVEKTYFGNVDRNDPFFDSFRADYPGFDKWFNRKADEEAYVCRTQEGSIVAFLYLKPEDEQEDYRDISPRLSPAKRLKVGTFKVVANGHKLGERFLKIIFDNALRRRVDEIYVTLFRHTAEHERLARLLADWGFTHYGDKHSDAGREEVHVRSFQPVASLDNPQATFPFMSQTARKFIVPIYPSYHTELLPDSILNTEEPEDYADNRHYRNALRKVYVSRSVERDLRCGDIVVFYRTKSEHGPAHYTAVATTLGIVQEVVTEFRSDAEFIAACRTRSVFSDTELRRHWNYKPRNRPFVVNFLYTYSLPVRPNLKKLKEERIIQDAPRGFERLTDQAFNTLLEVANADKYIVVD